MFYNLRKYTIKRCKVLEFLPKEYLARSMITFEYPMVKVIY